MLNHDAAVAVSFCPAIRANVIRIPAVDLAEHGRQRLLQYTSDAEGTAELQSRTGAARQSARGAPEEGSNVRILLRL